MVAAIRKVTDKPFKYLINSHHHGDHIGGNQFIPDNPVIISHPYCRDEVVKQVPGPALWAKREGWADGTEPRKILPATQTFDGTMTFHIAKTEVQIMPMLPAHTYGDLVMYLPEHKLLVAGDVGFFYVAPFCQNAHPSNWVSHLRPYRLDDGRRSRSCPATVRSAASSSSRRWPITCGS